MNVNGCGEAERLWRRYFAGSPKEAARGPVPEIESDCISFAKVHVHPEKDVPYPGLVYLFPAKEKGAPDVVVDVCPPLNARFPLVYKLEHGWYKRDPAGARKDPIEALFVQRYRCMRDFDDVKGDGRRLSAVVKEWAATDGNVRKALVANGTISKVTKIQEKELREKLDPKYLVGLEQVRDYMEGYHGALNPSKFKRALLSVAYRPVIMARAALRTMRNPDEVGAKGTRTFWSNVPVGILVSLLVAAVALTALNRSHKKTA
jgi:hypothetical protein